MRESKAVGVALILGACVWGSSSDHVPRSWIGRAADML